MGMSKVNAPSTLHMILPPHSTRSKLANIYNKYVFQWLFERSEWYQESPIKENWINNWRQQAYTIYN